MSEQDTLDLAAELIKKFEGCSLVPYTCPGGYLTIGWGHRTTPGTYKSITQEHADDLLIEDIEHFAGQIMDWVAPYKDKKEIDLTSNQMAALISLVFNIGMGAFKKSKCFRYLNEANFEKALQEWDWYESNGKLLKGLVRRRFAEAMLFLHPQDEPVDIDLIVEQAARLAEEKVNEK